MKFHIVRNKETLEDILYIYNLTKDEMVEQNKHIRVWDKLIPGTKLRIPPISEAVALEVSDIEPFVEDYYPSIANTNLASSVLKPNNLDDNSQEVDLELDNKGELENKSEKIYQEYEEKEVKKEKQKLEEKKLVVKKENENIKQIPESQGPQSLNNYYPYYLGVYNAPRYIPYPIIYYPVYYPKKPK